MQKNDQFQDDELPLRQPIEGDQVGLDGAVANGDIDDQVDQEMVDNDQDEIDENEHGDGQ